MMLHVSGLASRPHADERPHDEDASAVTEAREAGPLSLSSRYEGYVGRGLTILSSRFARGYTSLEWLVQRVEHDSKNFGTTS